MNRALPAAMDEAPEPLIDAMAVNDKDRHVLTLAVHAGASVIVTDNLRDFPAVQLERFEVEAIDVDAFVLDHVGRDPGAVLASVDAMARRRRRPPRTRDEIVDVLRQRLPSAMAELAWTR